MSAITLGLHCHSVSPVTSLPALVLMGLVGGQAIPGDTLRAQLSDGMTVASYAWGSSPGGAQYSTSAILVVPAEAQNSLLYVTATTDFGTFSTVVGVQGSVFATAIEEGSGKIGVQSLAPVPELFDLLASAGPAVINVEIA